MRSLSIALMLGAALATVHADTISETATLPVSGNSVDLTYALPEFDPANGLRSDARPAGSFVGINGNASLSGTAEVTYTYRTAPEPSSLALMLAGAMTLISLVHARRQPL
jgi:hypothetical protein